MEIKHIVSVAYQQPEAGFLHSGCSHSHWELCYVVSGELHAVVDGNHLALSQGQMLLCAPEQFHMCYAQEGQSPSFAIIIFDAQELTARSLCGTVLNTGTLSPALERMVQEYTHPDRFSEDVVFHLLSFVMLQLCRDGAKLPDVHSRRPQHGENDIIRRAQQHIANYLREKLSVTLVANRIHVSPSYMTALFHKHLGISPGEYIRRAKLQESKRLIQEGNMNFTEIAAALEYSTVHHFSRQFKEHFGMTPTDYAKSVSAKGV